MSQYFLELLIAWIVSFADAVCISTLKGERKTPVETVELQENYGIAGDARAGDWHRHVSLLAMESIDKVRGMGLDVTTGDFAEDITTQWINLPTLPLRTRLTVGDTLLGVTQIGKECPTRCAIFHQAGDCVMPKEGIFATVLRGGRARPRDGIRLVQSSTTWLNTCCNGCVAVSKSYQEIESSDQ